MRQRQVVAGWLDEAPLGRRCSVAQSAQAGVGIALTSFTHPNRCHALSDRLCCLSGAPRRFAGLSAKCVQMCDTLWRISANNEANSIIEGYAMTTISTDSWSETLQLQTREAIRLMPLTPNGSLHFKHTSQGFAFITLDELLQDRLAMRFQSDRDACQFADVDALVQAGWAVD